METLNHCKINESVAEIGAGSWELMSEKDALEKISGNDTLDITFILRRHEAEIRAKNVIYQVNPKRIYTLTHIIMYMCVLAKTY